METYHLAVLFIVVLGGVLAQETCNTGQLDVCMVPTLMLARKSLMPRNEKELGKACNTWKGMWTCVDKFTNKCFSDLHRIVLNLVVEHERKAQNEICDPKTELHKDAIKYGSCLQLAIQASHRNCMDNLENTVYTFFGDSVEDRIPAACCFFNSFYDCFYEGVEEICGGESLDFVKKASDMLSFEQFRSICGRYDPASELCIDYANRNATMPTADDHSYVVRFILTLMRHRKS